MDTTKRTPAKQKSAIRSRIEELERPMATGAAVQRAKTLSPSPDTATLSSLPGQTVLSKPRIQLLTSSEVQEILNVKRTFVTEHVAAKTMPQPLKFGSGRRAAIRFFEHEIHQYVMDLAAQRDQTGAGPALQVTAAAMEGH
ncbi:putative DNA-binding transcriptional regulator AlpA [Duganella sp. 3397]|uniref:helix-turn-helix transcriptional regulator n=1 Tax=Duganella sp. 3397 TaxID=2817732 RepID=UPI002864BC86|nr:helix-turn-helix domain-containing protein [Duganella sp. 3397]MDR7050803.1 putative DNA-binding transcriptional regulator AlpA [Duganella sp. 3397]